VGQLEPEEFALSPGPPTLNVPKVFLIFLLPHLLHLSSIFSEVTPIKGSGDVPPEVVGTVVGTFPQVPSSSILTQIFSVRFYLPV
jgi:hypothetical protein